MKLAELATAEKLTDEQLKSKLQEIHHVADLSIDAVDEYIALRDETDKKDLDVKK